jgi:peptidoglycan/xylan/chitin deacetylase (PgdA/CDA1 family)
MSDTKPGRSVTIITWHYVRDGAPADLHARTVAEFDHQLEHIAAQFVPVTLDAVVAATQDSSAPLPANACLLTFDDGYRDHFEIVFPRLADRDWQGVFFPVARAARDHEVLDVNKIQFSIAAAGLETISDETRAAIDDARADCDLPDSQTLYSELAVAGLHNPPEAMFVKRALQTRLPEVLRARICSELFSRHVSSDEQDFAKQLYANVDELRDMQAGGMALGGHGERHNRMNELSPEARDREFEGSREFLDSLGLPTGDGWSFCYPYGAFDDATISAARQAGCTTAFTLEPRVVDLSRDTPLALPRIDTNDLPVTP